MAEYHIDYNRGNDSNAGTTRATAWKELSKLASLTLNDGDTVFLASDSTWTNTDRVLMGTVAGTSAQPVTITRYDAGGGLGTYPTIQWQISIPAGSWTYDAPNNAWYYDAGFSAGVYSWIMCGSLLAKYKFSGLPLPSDDGVWTQGSGGTVNRIYLYAPSGTNPTAYYGSVTFSPSDRGAITFSNDGTYVVVDSLRFTRTGTGVLAFGSSGTRELIVQNCMAYDTGPILNINTTTAGDYAFTMQDCYGEMGVGPFVLANSVGGVGIGTYTIQRNTFKNFNRGFPQGAIYLQVRSAAGTVKNNVISDAKYGTAYQTDDGCAIYTEIGASNVTVTGNYIYDCYCGAQDNSGRTTTWIGNIFKDCTLAMKVTDESNANATNHTFHNNTIINGGTTKNSPTGPNAVPGGGWFAYETTSPPMTLSIKNNIFVRDPSGTAFNAAIETPTTATGTFDKNWYWGYNTLAESYLGGNASNTPTGTVNADPILDPRGKPTNARFFNGGATVSGSDFYGNTFPASPSIGAIQCLGVYPRANLTTYDAVGDKESWIARRGRR